MFTMSPVTESQKSLEDLYRVDPPHIIKQPKNADSVSRHVPPRACMFFVWNPRLHNNHTEGPSYGNRAPAGVYNAAGERKGDSPTLAKNARMGHPPSPRLRRTSPPSPRLRQTSPQNQNPESRRTHPCKERKDGASAFAKATADEPAKPKAGKAKTGKATAPELAFVGR
jgi:hypothetical protein